MWRALVDREERIAWEPGFVEAIDVPDSYPRAGQHARWRYRVGNVPLTLHDRPWEVSPHTRVCTRIEMGPLRFDATMTLAGLRGGDRTRFGMKLSAPNMVPVVGGMIDRFAVREMCAGWVDRTVRALRTYCEKNRANPELLGASDVQILDHQPGRVGKTLPRQRP